MQGGAPRGPMMNWLPIARDFREDLGVALAQAKPTDGLEGLASLAACRLGFLETIQLDRALARLGAKEAPGYAPVRLAILASSTVDHLSPAIRVAGLRRKLLIDVHSGAYGQYRQDLLDPASALHRFQPQTVLFSLSAREAIAGVALTATVAEVDGVVGRFIAELRSLWRKAREIGGAAVIQQTFLDVSEPLFGGYDRMVPGRRRRSSPGSTTRCARRRGATACLSSISRARASATASTPGSTSGAGFRASSKSRRRRRPLRRSRRPHPRGSAGLVEEMPGARSRQHAMGRRDR